MAVAPTRFLGWLGVLTAALATLIVLSIRATAELRDQATRAEAQTHTLATLREQRAALAAEQPSTDDLEKLVRDEAVLTAERAALEEQRAEFQRAALAAMQRTHAAPALPPAPPGRASPQATVDSIILAVRYGETDDLAGLIDFDPAARAEAESFFASLPPDLRAQYKSPEQLVAQVMAAKTGGFAATSTDQLIFRGTDEASMRLNLQYPSGTVRTPTLEFRRDAEGWKLRVPAKVIEGYRARVTGVMPASVVNSAGP